MVGSSSCAMLLLLLLLLALLLAPPAAAPAEQPTLADVWAAGSYQDFPGTVMVRSHGDRSPGGPPFQLVYLALRGLGELPRLMLEASGMPYEGIYYGKADLQAAKPSLPLGRVPVLLNYDGQGNALAQSAAIVRHIGSRTGLSGPNPHARAQVDMLYESVKELFVSHGSWGRPFSIAALKEGIAAGEQPSTHFRETSNRGEHSEFEKSAAALLTFEEILAENEAPGDYLVGDALTYADLALWLQLFELSEEDNMPRWQQQLPFPRLSRFKTNIDTMPRIQKYLQSERFMPRNTFKHNKYVFIEGQFSAPPPGVTPGMLVAGEHPGPDGGGDGGGGKQEL
jgi:glutathione S-transferase